MFLISMMKVSMIFKFYINAQRFFWTIESGRWLWPLAVILFYKETEQGIMEISEQQSMCFCFQRHSKEGKISCNLFMREKEQKSSVTDRGTTQQCKNESVVITKRLKDQVFI